MNRQTRPRVLVVDNDEDVCLYLRKKLAEAGYETTSTWSGIEALNLLKTVTFDLLVVDDYLSDLYIGQFLQKLSNVPVCPRIFVMRTSSQNTLQARGSPVFICIDKNCASKILEALIDKDESGPQSRTH